MRHHTSLVTGIALAASLSLAACGKHDNTNVSNGEVAAPAATPTTAAAPVDTVPAKHHSKLGGALIGAAAGHVLGGHAMAGAAAGAIIQHERNKHQ